MHRTPQRRLQFRQFDMHPLGYRRTFELEPAPRARYGTDVGKTEEVERLCFAPALLPIPAIGESAKGDQPCLLGV